MCFANGDFKEESVGAIWERCGQDFVVEAVSFLRFIEEEISNVGKHVSFINAWGNITLVECFGFSKDVVFVGNLVVMAKSEVSCSDVKREVVGCEEEVIVVKDDGVEAVDSGADEESGVSIITVKHVVVDSFEVLFNFPVVMFFRFVVIEPEVIKREEEGGE